MSWICCCSKKHNEIATTPAETVDETVALLASHETPLTQLIKDLGTSTLHAEFFSRQHSLFGPHNYFVVEPRESESADKEKLTLSAIDKTTRRKINRTITLVLNPENQEFSILGDVFMYKCNTRTSTLIEHPIHFDIKTLKPRKADRMGGSGFDFTLSRSFRLTSEYQADTFTLTPEIWTEESI